jgi:hypothetical protein
MRRFDARIVSLLAVTLTLAGCHPLRDVRPPYREPAAAKSASEAPTPRPATRPGG